MKPLVREVPPAELSDFLMQHDRVLVEFHSCISGPCLLANAVFAAFAEGELGDLVCVRCNGLSVANTLPKIESSPAFVLYDHGKAIRITEGLATISSLEQLVPKQASGVPSSVEDGIAKQPCQLGMAIPQVVSVGKSRKANGGG